MKKKSCIAAMVLLATVITTSIPVFAGQANMPIKVDGQVVRSEVSPQLANNRLLVPIRFVSEALGAEVSWDNRNQTVIVTKDSKAINVVVGQKTAQVNGKAKDMDVAAQLIDGRTMVPVRFLAEALDFIVDYTRDAGVNIVRAPIKNEKIDAGEIGEIKGEVELTTGIALIGASPIAGISLTVANDTDEVVETVLAGGQDYEVIIFNQQGEKVWQYSDDKFFTLAIRMIAFQPGENKAFEIEIPQLEPGSYSMEVYYLGISRQVPVGTLEVTVE
ncbi:MAG: stalk domain-containing protein [Bacillota bacterium]|nr:stalk domain-containing protein [Bacillota bacterium]